MSKIFRVLDSHAEDRGPITALQDRDEAFRFRDSRDWHKLRKALIDLDLNDRSLVAAWLTDVGYVPDRLVKFRNNNAVLADGTANISWNADDVNSHILDWVATNQNIVDWLGLLNDDGFRNAVLLASRYFEDSRPYNENAITEEEKLAVEWLANPINECPVMDVGNVLQRMNERTARLRAQDWGKFLVDIKAPSGVTDPQLLQDYLGKSLIVPKYHAIVTMEADAMPLLHIHAEKQTTAISVAVSLDRRLRRGIIACRNCSTDFKQTKSTDLFCSQKCHDRWHTTERRRKVRALQDWEQKWSKFSILEKGELDQWKWIAEHASDSLEMHPKIDPAWAKRELEKAQQKRAKK